MESVIISVWSGDRNLQWHHQNSAVCSFIHVVNWKKYICHFTSQCPCDALHHISWFVSLLLHHVLYPLWKVPLPKNPIIPLELMVPRSWRSASAWTDSWSWSKLALWEAPVCLLELQQSKYEPLELCCVRASVNRQTVNQTTVCQTGG